MKWLSEKVEKALELACKAHEGQKDKSGMPYINHPVHVAMTLMANGYGDSYVIAGLLHDVAEDTEYGLDEIAKLGFGRNVMDALALLTHDKSVPYADYVECVAENPIARAVKMADLMHNMDLTRLEKADKSDFERVKKYHKAYDFLKDYE